MVIAVTYNKEDGTIFGHFGRTEAFKLYTVEDGKITASEVVSSAETGGHSALAPFLREKGRAQLSDLVLHIRHMVNCAGEDAVALGSDFDGFDPADCPEGAGSVLDVGKVLSSLEKNGFTQRQIEKIARDNVRRLIEDTW